MYDILQLNDMLVPELHDIAEQLKIQNAKKLDKQELIYKILDKQAVTASAIKTPVTSDDKGRRKRIVKTSTANSTEEAIVESGDQDPPERSKRVESKRPEMKKPVEKVDKVQPKRGRKKETEPTPALPLKEEDSVELQEEEEIETPSISGESESTEGAEGTPEPEYRNRQNNILIAARMC
jgi:transcription termination factor Rho